jgi:thiamine biosynthesis protein ThiS
MAPQDPAFTAESLQGAAAVTEPTISLTLNGQTTLVPAGLTVAGLLDHLAIAAVGVAVEHNRRVVRRADHATTALAADDVLEIVRFVGGG